MAVVFRRHMFTEPAGLMVCCVCCTVSASLFVQCPLYVHLLLKGSIGWVYSPDIPPPPRSYSPVQSCCKSPLYWIPSSNGLLSDSESECVFAGRQLRSRLRMVTPAVIRSCCADKSATLLHFKLRYLLTSASCYSQRWLQHVSHQPKSRN